MELTEREKQNRNLLSNKKPIVWAKIQRFSEQIQNHKSIALLQIQYDYKCNMNCIFCAIEKFRDNPGKNKLSIKDIKRIADQADKMGLSSICISGGEPLLFHDLKDVINAIDSSRFVVSIDTNGFLLTENKVKELVDLGVDRIHLSMDGLSENHFKTRKLKDSWERTVKALDYCKQHGLGIIINIVATKDLVKSKEIEKQLEFLKSYNLHSSLIYAKPVGTFEEAKDQVLNSEDFDYLESLTKKYNCSTHLTPNNGTDLGCLCFKRHFSCTAFGDILPCPWIPISMGNIFEEDLETIMNRGLSNPWFSFDNYFTCHSGNSDSYFYQNIISQIEKHEEYPVPHTMIDWHLEYFNDK